MQMHSSEVRRWLAVTLVIVAAWALVGPAGSAHAAPLGGEVIYTVQPGDTLRSIAAEHGVTIGAIVRANGLANPDVIYPGQRFTIPDAGASSSSTGTSETSAPAAAAAPSGVVYHTVALGDTLGKIAARYGVSVAALAQANRIDNPDLIWVGQRLLVSDASPASAPTAARPAVTATAAPAATARPAITSVPAAPVLPAVTAIPAATMLPAQPTVTPVPASPIVTVQATAQPTAAPALPKPTVYTVQPGDTLGSIAQQFSVTVAALVAMNDLPDANILRIGQQLIIPLPGSETASVKPTKFVVDISDQRCYLYQQEALLAKWVCSTGRPGAATRPGSYKIQSKLVKAYGSTWNIWMPYWLGIYWAGASENGIHGLPWSAATGAQVWTGYVGTPITYGCVMLDNVNSKMLYDMAYIGMPVIIRP